MKLKEGSATPWGLAQAVAELGNGMYEVATASHGGMYVPDELLHRIPMEEREFAASWSHGWGDNWYEEDSAILAPMYHFQLARTPSMAQLVQRRHEELVDRIREISKEESSATPTSASLPQGSLDPERSARRLDERRTPRR